MKVLNNKWEWVGGFQHTDYAQLFADSWCMCQVKKVGNMLFGKFFMFGLWMMKLQVEQNL